MALSPVRNGPGGGQRELPASGAPVQRVEKGAFVRNDRFERSADQAEVDPAVVQDRELHTRLKQIAERRDAADPDGAAQTGALSSECQR